MTPHPTTVTAASDHEPDWTFAGITQYELIEELRDIATIMEVAGRHGPLRDTIPALIADAAGLTRLNHQLAQQLTQANRDIDLANKHLARSRADADEYARRASWVLRQAMTYCVNEVSDGADD